MSSLSKVARSRLLAAVVSVALGAASLAALPGGSAAAATCTLVPQLRDITVTQGVGSYSPLVRGKEALVRSYLSLPSCATVKGQSIAVTRATLNVTTSGTTPITTSISPDNLVTSPAPLLAPFTSAPAVDSPADTRFVIPGSVLAPANTARYTATMTVTIDYSSKASLTASAIAGSVRFTTVPGSTAPISRTVEKKTNALRILVVPMGDPRVGYAQQFDAAAQSTTAGAMRALARTLPVPDGTGDLTSTTSAAGIRYAVTPTIADITSFKDPITNKFCGTAANFDGVAANLSTFLQSWNTNNPLTPADRVIGVVSDRLSSGGEVGCAEGMSKVGQPITWTRLVPDGITPSQTGSTMAMEIAHTFGDVPLNGTNADTFSRYHSKNTQADDTAPNRAYNVPTRQFLATDRTVMAVRDTWNDQTTLLEPADWAFTLCALTPTPLLTSCPATTTTVGTAQGVGAEPTFVISGVITKGDPTTGAPTTADITESYFKNGVPRFNVDNNSPYRLVQRDSADTTIPDGGDVGLAVNFDTSDHDHNRSLGTPESGVVTAENTASFTAAVPFKTGAERIVLEKDGVVLYARNRVVAPVVTGVIPSGASGTERASVGTGPASGSDAIPSDNGTYASDISGDGNLVVFRTAAGLDSVDTNVHDDIYLRDVANETTTLITTGRSDGLTASDGASYDPVISADGRFVAFVSAAGNLVDPSPLDGLSHLYVYDVETGNLDLADLSSDIGEGRSVANASAIGRPVLSATGRYVAFTSSAANLTYLAEDDGGVAPRVYLRDLGVEGETELASVRSNGCSATGFSCVDHGERPGSVTSDGRYVSFLSDTRLTVGDDLEGSPLPGTFGAYVRDMRGGGEGGPGPDTRLVAYGRGASPSCEVECSLNDAPMNGDVLSPPLLSPLSGPDEARYVVFDSDASNLVESDFNGASDVFVRDMTGGAFVTRISEAPGATPSPSPTPTDTASPAPTASPTPGAGDLNGDTYLLDVTPDLGCNSSLPSCANKILMSSNASNFVMPDTNNIQDVFVYDFATSSDTGPVVATRAGDGTRAKQDLGTIDILYESARSAGGISDDGRVTTFISTAPNLVGEDSEGGYVDSNHQPDAFVRTLGGGSGGSGSGSGEPYTVTAKGSNPDNLRIDLVFRCGAVNYPVAVALQPDDISGRSASWSLNVDPSLIGSCPGGGALVAIANDGFSTSESVAAPTQPLLESQPPAPSIYGPAPGDAYSTYLQYSTVTLDGTARDAEDGVLPGSSLAWFITPPGGSEAPVGTGTSVRRAPLPATGWAPGVYGVRLLATDSDGSQTSTTSSFTVFADADNDGVPAGQDRLGNPGSPCSTGSVSGDGDPSNAYADPDGDGITTIDEIALGEQPCVAATGGTAGATTLRIDPNPVPTSSGNPVTGYLTVANAAETQVLASSLRLKLTATTAGGAIVTLNPSILSSSATSTLFAAKISRQQILAFAKTYNLYGRSITVQLTGYVSGSGPITATTALTVKK
ncbi:MAG: hypothetical protein LH645_03645 [Actinomycetia bacterium]|nr:hypothetical protein [Actinomycetes bacterium]